MLRRCPKCRKDGGLVYCPVCHGVKRDGEAMAALAELVRLKDGPRDDAYRAEKDAAWDTARKIVKG